MKVKGRETYFIIFKCYFSNIVELQIHSLRHTWTEESEKKKFINDDEKCGWFKYGTVNLAKDRKKRKKNQKSLWNSITCSKKTDRKTLWESVLFGGEFPSSSRFSYLWMTMVAFQRFYVHMIEFNSRNKFLLYENECWYSSRP